MYFKVSVLMMAVVGYTLAHDGYHAGGSGGSGGYGAGGAGGAGGYGGGASGYNQNAAPEPYKFDYQAADEQGNVHYRTEEGDANGNVKGSYGYTDTQGLYRVVEYVADANGYRANIRTNEPGTDGKESPADVQMTVEQPPAGIQDKYTNAGSSRGGYSGAASAGGYSSGGSGSGFGGGAGGFGGNFGGAAGGSSSYGSSSGSSSYGSSSGSSSYGSSSGSSSFGSSSGAQRGGAGVRSGKSGY